MMTISVRNHRRSMLVTGGLVAATCAALVATGPSTSGAPGEVDVFDAGIVGSGAWALTSSGLLLSDDTQSWRNVTPPNSPTLDAASFASTSTGVAASNRSGSSLLVYRTRDGGNSWRLSRVS